MTLPANEQGIPAAQLFATFKAGYQALGQLLEQHRAYLLKIMSSEMDEQLRGREGGSDIVQDTFLNIFANLERATGGIFAVTADEDLRKWLRRVGLNALKKKIRDHGRKQRDYHQNQPVPDGFEQPASGPSPSSIYCQRERDEVLTQAINRLPEADRMLLRLYDWHDWTHMALAELLNGEKSDAGRMDVRRRLAKLYIQLGEDGSIQDLRD